MKARMLQIPKLTIRGSRSFSLNMVLANTSRIKATPLRGRFASLDTSAMVKGWRR